MFDDELVLIKGAGDLATGVAWRLHRCGFAVVMTELERPLAVRRMVAFAQAVFDGEHTVEDVTARCCHVPDVPDVLMADEIPVLVDPRGDAVSELIPSVLVDGTMAKGNATTSLADAPFVLALGPGFEAGVDCHAVVETNRGHALGRVIWSGAAEADTGTPGAIPGVGVRVSRALRAPMDGRIAPRYDIGQHVGEGDTIAVVHGPDGRTASIVAAFSGVLRGMVHPSVPIVAGMKVGDLDPRDVPAHCFTISDKSLAVAGGVLEAILSRKYRE